MLIRIISILFGFILSSSLSAQTLKGKLVDDKNAPLPYANVVLLSLPDSSFVTGVISDENGLFTLEKSINNGVLKISSIGYITLYKSIATGDLGVVKLQSDMQQLNEVVVKGNLQRTAIKGNQMVTTVAGSLLEKAGTGNDLLDKIPGVSATEGQVSVFGSGAAEVYINGRKMRDPSELDQLSSENIKSVEVIRTPGARYGAHVKAVVRIATKKIQGEGFGFTNRAFAFYRYNWLLLDQFNFNYRKQGFDLGGSLLGSDNQYDDNKQLLQHTYLDKEWKQDSYLQNRFHLRNLEARLSMNYTFNEKHSLGARYNLVRSPLNDYGMKMQTAVYLDGVLDEETKGVSDANGTSNSHRANLYYNGQFKNWNIDFNADGMWGDKDQNAFNEDVTTRPNGGKITDWIHNQSLRTNRLYAAKLVVEHPLWSGNLSLGSEYSNSFVDENYRNVEGLLSNSSNTIKENAVSVFMEYARAFGKLQAQIGVRYDHLDSKYYEFDKKVDSQSRIYDNIFPSLSLSYPAGDVRLMLSYAGKIDRPDYKQLTNTIIYGNRYTYQGGNPMLRPSISQNLSMNAVWKWILVSVNYSHLKDVVVQISKAYRDDVPAVSLLTYKNVSKADRMNVMLSLTPTVGIWSPRFDIMYAQQWFWVDVPKGRKNLNTPLANFVWENTFRLPCNIQFSVTGRLTTPGETETIRTVKPFGAINLSVYKGFMNDQLSLMLQVNDLFATSKQNFRMYSGNRTVEAHMETKCGFGLTLRYKFNVAKSKYKGSGAGESQKNRM